MKSKLQLLNTGALALLLCACGGGGGGGDRPQFTPTPTPAPSPTPAPAPPPPVQASESVEFDVVGSDVRLRWDNDAKVYEIMVPGGDWANLIPSANDYKIQDSGGGTIGNAHFTGSGTYSYTGFASISVTDSSHRVAYGIATPVFGVPVTGSASYKAELWGSGGGYSVGGTAQFDFDFAAGTLTGFMKPMANDPAGWGPYPLGRYDFVQTIYSAGSPTFSGDLSNGSLGGSFSGLFAGPAAQELMGQWQFSFRNIYAPDQTVDATGVFVGKAGQ